MKPAKLVFVVLALIVAQQLNGVPVPALNVPWLEQQSDAVLVGVVQKVQDAGATTVSSSGQSVEAHVQRAEFIVDDVLKGTNIANTVTFSFVVPTEFIGYRTVVPGYQLLFLKFDGSTYTVSSPYYPSIPAAPGPKITAGSTIDKVSRYLSRVLDSPDTQLSTKKSALFALNTIPGTEATLGLKAGLQQQNSALRLNAAAFLLLRDDLSGLQTAENALLNPKGLPSAELHNLTYALSEGVKDPSAVPALARLSRSNEITTRTAAASALAHTRSRTALVPLAKLLDDPDARVRYDAILGLAKITGESDWAPSREAFKTDEAKFVNHWHEWARTYSY